MATTVKMYDTNGSEHGTVDLPAHLFDCEVSEPAMHQAVVTYLANQRQGTASSKERSDVRGGGRKPFRQKGTGRARQGTSRSPQQRGGGVVFGPHPRSYRKAMPKKLRRLALRSALSSRAQDGVVVVIDDLSYEAPKTRDFANMLKSMGSYHSKVLVVLDKPNEYVIKSARNIRGIRLTLGASLNTYELLWADRIILSQGALKAMEEVFA